jgi:hypothetical protein
MTPLTLIVATLAAYRISRMITAEEGPFGAFLWLREHIDRDQQSWVGRGLNCILCVSFWVTGAIALVLGATWLEWLGMAGAIVMWREAIAK